MLMNAIATISLIECLHTNITQVWYVNDACECGSIAQLRQWWQCLYWVEPGYRYTVNATKTWLVTSLTSFQLLKPSFQTSE